MFNLAVYGVVDKVLLQKHILRSILAATLDMNDFLHVESVYLPWSASGSGLALQSASELLPTADAPHAWRSPTPARTVRPPLAHPAVPSSIERRTAVEDFNVGQFLVESLTELPPSSRLLKQESTSMVPCFSMSRFSSATRATRTILPRSVTPAANARLQESPLYVSLHQWTKTSTVIRILMCRVGSS